MAMNHSTALCLYRLVHRRFSTKNSRLLSSLIYNLSGKAHQERREQLWVYRRSLDARLLFPTTLAIEARTFNTDCLKHDTLNNGKIVRFTWANGDTAAFHAVWLRHNCQCSSCTTSNNQRAINPSVLDPDMSVTSTSVSGKFKTNHRHCIIRCYLGHDL